MPLALLFAALVVYASLYPFEGWRWPGASVATFVSAPLPRYWTGFDVGANLVGYGPLGFLLALALLRSGWGRWAWPLAVLAGAPPAGGGREGGFRTGSSVSSRSWPSPGISTSP